MRRFLFIFLFVSFFIHTKAASENYAKYFDDINELESKELYRSANQKCESLIKKIIKSDPNSIGDLSLAYAYLSYFQIKAGIIADIEKPIQSSLDKINKLDDSFKASIYLKITDAYLEYGNLVKAEEFLAKATKYDKIYGFKYDLLVRKCELLSKKGHMRDAVSLSDSLLPLFEKRLVKKEQIEVAKGQYQTVKVSKEELLRRTRQLGILKYIWAKNHFDFGDYAKADSAISENLKWVRKNITDEHPLYVMNRTYKGLSYLHKREESEAASEFRQVLDIGKKFVTNDVYFQAMKNLMLLLVEDAQAKTMSLINQYEGLVKMNYGKKNLYIAKSRLLVAERGLIIVGPDYALKKLNKFYEELDGVIPEKHHLYADAADLHVKILLIQQNSKEAAKILEQSLAIRKALLGEKSPTYHRYLLEASNFYYTYTNDFKKIENIFEKSYFSILNKELKKYHPINSDILYEIVGFYDLIDDDKKAIKYAKELSDIDRVLYGEFSAQYAFSLEELGKLYMKKGDYDLAEQKLNKCVSIIEGLKSRQKIESIKIVEVYETLSRLEKLLGNYGEAEKNLLIARRFIRKFTEEDQLLNSKAIDEQAEFFISTGRYEKAQKLLEESLELKKENSLNYERESINTLSLLAKINLTKGEYGEAEKNLKEAIGYTKGIFGETSVKYIPSLDLSVQLFEELGDLERAEDAALDALAIAKSHYSNNHLSIAKAYSQLAIIQFYLDYDINKVEELLKIALDIIKNSLSTSHPVYAQQIEKLAQIEISKGNAEAAIKHLNTALGIYEAKFGKGNVHTVNGLILLGQVYLSQKKYTEAIDNYERASSILQSSFSKTHPDYVKTQGELARAYYIMGDYKKSLPLFSFTTSNYLNFIEQFFPSLSFREKSKFWSQFKEEFELYNLVASKMLNDKPELVATMYNNTIATKALLLSSSIKIRRRILNSGDTTLVKQYSKWISKKEILARALSMNSSQIEEAQIDISAIEKEVEELEKSLSSASELFASNFESKSVDWKSVKKAIGKGNAAIEIIRFREYDGEFTDKVNYAALIINDGTNKAPIYVGNNKGKLLESRYLKYYRNNIRFQQDESESYNAYWKSIDSIVATSKVIYLSSEGVYNQINVETLLDEEGSHVLDDYQIALVSNTKDIVLASRSAKKEDAGKKGEAILIGNPKFYLRESMGDLEVSSLQLNLGGVFGKTETTTKVEKRKRSKRKKIQGKLQQLPGAEEEVNQLDKIIHNKGIDSKKVMFEDADEEWMKNINDPLIFHIATHGYFADDKKARKKLEGEQAAVENPLLKSGLVMSGGGDILSDENLSNVNTIPGVLTAYEAMNLNFDNTELVVLSACETGRGEVQMGEGVYGLQRSILVAGADALVMSLFKVNDNVTQKLMTTFYSKWLNGMDKRSAFLEAKREIKKTYKEPIYWGAFILIGS